MESFRSDRSDTNDKPINTDYSFHLFANGSPVRRYRARFRPRYTLVPQNDPREISVYDSGAWSVISFEIARVTSVAWDRLAIDIFAFQRDVPGPWKQKGKNV